MSESVIRRESKMKELDEICQKLSLREDRGLLTEGEKTLISFVFEARPFLSVLNDIVNEVENAIYPVSFNPASPSLPQRRGYS